MHDIVAAPVLLDGIAGGDIIADKAYDSNAFRQSIADAGMLALIPSTRSRKIPIPPRTHTLQNPQPRRTQPVIF